MKKTIGILTLLLAFVVTHAQDTYPNRAAIEELIRAYNTARETRDTGLLRTLLTDHIDQLVSTGEWRTGIEAAIEGMVNSSAVNPGTRTLRVEKIRFLADDVAMADCRYEIRKPDNSSRLMWSCFVLVHRQSRWQISAIRNMLPAP